MLLYHTGCLAMQNAREQVQQLELSLESLAAAIGIVVESITSSAQINQRWNEEHKIMLDMVSERLASICDQGKQTMSTVAEHSSSIRSDIADLSQEQVWYSLVMTIHGEYASDFGKRMRMVTQAKIWKQMVRSTSDIQEEAKKRFVDAVTRISVEVAADMSRTVESSLESAQSSMQAKTNVVTQRLNEIQATARFATVSQGALECLKCGD